jgi:diguanylate cyclase (GGDEF)-like protein
MPGVDGVTLCQEIRRVREPAPPYVILVTSNSSREHVVSGLSSGADDYVVKPFDWDELRARVNIGARTVGLQQRLLHLSMVDELTGLYNRRGFATLAERHLTLARRKAAPVLLLAIDVDGLKAINDQHGHAAGDRALAATAVILRNTYRSADLIARLGGDEFVVFPLEASPETGGVLLNRLQSNIDDYNSRQDTECALSISAGMAWLESTACATVEGLLLAADRELYRQKRLRPGRRPSLTAGGG